MASSANSRPTSTTSRRACFPWRCRSARSAWPAAGRVAYMLGNHMAQRILGGVVAGTALVLLAPELMA